MMHEHLASIMTMYEPDFDYTRDQVFNHAVLIVTKNERFIPCTKEFMPTHIFATSNDQMF